MKWIDLPPVWLAVFALASWGLAKAAPGLSFGGAWAQFAGGLLVGAGLILMALAVVEMRRWRTTVIPHMQASHLVTSGIFSRSRNPIYLGDALVLAGLILRWDAVLALPMVALFVWLIGHRFIAAEEARLRDRFGPAFERYCAGTRRWL